MIEMLVRVMVVIGIVAFVGCAFVLIRNEWVHAARMKVLDQGMEEFHKLPSYDEMLFRFWIWDAEKFKR